MLALIPESKTSSKRDVLPSKNQILMVTKVETVTSLGVIWSGAPQLSSHLHFLNLRNFGECGIVAAEIVKEYTCEESPSDNESPITWID